MIGQPLLAANTLRLLLRQPPPPKKLITFGVYVEYMVDLDVLLELSLSLDVVV